MNFSLLGWCWSLFGCALFVISCSSQPQCCDKAICRDVNCCAAKDTCSSNRNSAKREDDSDITGILGGHRYQLHNKYRIDNADEPILETAEFRSARNCNITVTCCLKGKSGLPQCVNVSSLTCNESDPFRTYDGSCNNLQDPHLGQAGSCHQRILPPAYDDGMSSPRTKNGTLPNARAVCIAIHRVPLEPCNIPDRRLTALFMGFGQFIDHDVTLTTVETGANNSALQCCPTGGTNDSRCFPVILPPNDPDFESRCMNMSRAVRCRSCDGSPVREQRNAQTSFVDGSQIYGSTADQANTLLRDDADSAKLKVQNVAGVGALPPSNNQTCGNSPCFLTGDARANQNSALTLFHIVFVLFHNKVVDVVRSRHQNWTVEEVFQKTRKFVTAVYEHIVYHEYLPLLVGKGDDCNTRLYDSDTKYNSEQDPRTMNEVMGAAFRLHTLVPDFFFCIRNNSNMCEIVPLANNFFNVDIFYQPGGLQCMAQGISCQPEQASDPFLDSSVTKFLYLRSNNAPPRLDLCSINIQRGRDLGIPGYTKYVKHCLCRQIGSFNDLKPLICRRCLEKYKELYSSVHDIDLWTALQCEKRLKGALMGPVGTCLIRQQFNATKYGDRFFYTHEGVLSEYVKKCASSFSLAAVFCCALGLPEYPLRPFEVNSCMVNCKDLLLEVLKNCQLA